jgi:ABC-type multidrug transport system fused ATPase/permease subunit
MQTFKKLLFLLTPYERKRAGLLLIMILIMALLDMIGVASIVPFVAVLANPGLIETNSILKSMFQISGIFGVENDQQFLFILGLLVFALLVFSITFKAITTYIQVRFIQMRQYSISKRLIEGYLCQPYSWFLNHHSADLGKTILSEVGTIIGIGFNPLIEIITKGLVSIALITILIIADPKLAIIISLSLGGAYLLFFYFIRKYLNRIGSKRFKSNELRFTTISEAFGAAKEVKVGGLEETYVKLFSKAAKNYALTQASSDVVSQLPRFILEIIAFGGILLIVLYIISQTGNFNNALPIISLYVFAGYRLMPALQSIYSSCTQLVFVGPSLNKLNDDLKSLKPFNENQDQGILSLNNTITLKNVHYSYPNTSRTALKDVSFNIPAKTTVGLVGATGSGKTTMVDIILGLLEPQKGTLEIDGKVIKSHNSRSWQKSIGYVPQHIFLADDTVAANIAFGVETKYINQESVEKVAKIANLHDFVIEELSDQYQTTIGERGIRLSGGQRQRIGIARALYHNPQVLVLDEATSALDNQTEQAVMEAVNNLSKNVTIILIAHRLNTVKNCDIIYKLDKGRLIGKKTFDEIINENKKL